MSLKIPSLQLLYIDGIRYLPSLRDTLLLDKVNTTDEALVEIYKKLRPGEPPSPRALFEGLFFLPNITSNLVASQPRHSKQGLTDKDILRSCGICSISGPGRRVDVPITLGSRRVRPLGAQLEKRTDRSRQMERAIRKMTPRNRCCDAAWPYQCKTCYRGQ
jgi:DNA-directed RNA polymerase subunit beta